MNKIATLLLLCTTLFAQQKGIFTDIRDGKIYKTVKIGEQVWMAENLNYEAKGSRCYNDSTAYCKKFGRLYNWETAMKACPKFWHLPSKKEWEVLIRAVGSEKTAGKYLKAKSGWNSYQGKSGNGEDKFGFSALPGGFGNLIGYFMYVGINGVWWNSSEDNNDFAYYGWGIFYSGETVIYDDEYKGFLFNVRCLQD